MRRRRPISSGLEAKIELLESWIESGKPLPGSNVLLISPPARKAPIGRISGGRFSPYAGSELFSQIPLSDKTRRALKEMEYKKMTKIQRATLPHSLCGRSIIGASKTGTGKTLAFVIPVIEKLYRSRCSKEDGVGSIIISPTQILAAQLFEVLKSVGRYHELSAGLLIGGQKGVDIEKDKVNSMNILVCTPGRLLQHMNETPNFECPRLQILVLDEADRILDNKFKKEIDAIISQLPIERQTLLFSATQTKLANDLERLSLKDPEYISVHVESPTATPGRLVQFVMEIPLGQKLNMLWSFIKEHLSSKILVFLTTCKQVKFVHEVFKKLQPGIPVKCLYSRMDPLARKNVCFEFCNKTSVLFSTDVAARGLDFQSVDWVVQVDCPENVSTYIHRVGRTARFTSHGRAILFLSPSESEMITKLRAPEVNKSIKLKEWNMKKFQPIPGGMASLLAKYPNLQNLAKRACVTYLRSVDKQSDKQVFDVLKLPIKEYALSLGLPITPTVRFINRRKGGRPPIENGIIGEDIKKENKDKSSEGGALLEEENDDSGVTTGSPIKKRNNQVDEPRKMKKLKINSNTPFGTRMKFDEDGNLIPPLAAIADVKSGDGMLQLDKVNERYMKLMEGMKLRDEEDKLLQRQRMRKMKRTIREEEGTNIEDEQFRNLGVKRVKIYYDSDHIDGDGKTNSKKNLGNSLESVSLAEQETLALQLLNSIHS